LLPGNQRDFCLRSAPKIPDVKRLPTKPSGLSQMQKPVFAGATVRSSSLRVRCSTNWATVAQRAEHSMTWRILTGTGRPLTVPFSRLNFRPNIITFSLCVH